MSIKRLAEALEIDILEEEETPDELRIIKEEKNRHDLTSLDDDDEILGIPLRLDEACSLDFEKHMEAIVPSEVVTIEEHVDIAQENKQEYDRRYKEMPRDRIKFKK